MTVRAYLEITQVAAATVQDGGRIGHMHEGVPVGGALVPELLAYANRAVGNRWDAPAIEYFGALRAIPHGGIRAVTVEPPQSRVRYLAVAGGFAVPRVLDGAGTLLTAHIGGFDGRPLRRGDRLPVDVDLEKGLHDPGSVASTSFPDTDLLDTNAPIRVVIGPDVDRISKDAISTLLTATYTISPTSDRTGYRLDGPPLPRRDDDTAASSPMTRGAIQLPAGGGPIVLGPDHPTTGGYPVIAVVIRADQGRLFARPSGASVRFTSVTVDEARAAWAAHRARW